MKKFQIRIVIIVGLLLAIFSSGIYFRLLSKQPSSGTREPSLSKDATILLEQGLPINQPSRFVLLSLPKHAFQTFNNCGPATLSMVMSYYGIDKSQQELGKQLRPFQNPQGNNDDKSVTLPELAKEAENYELSSYYRPNGTIELLKLFVSNDIPVVTRTLLKAGGDIGHYRIVRGFDEDSKQIIQDDSLQGTNRRYSYDEFLTLWQPFGYEYLVLVPEEKEGLVKAILGKEQNESIAWTNSIVRHQREIGTNPQDPYPIFNQALSFYHLGQYQKAIEAFEAVEAKLPYRILWYQIEPILAYAKTGNVDRVFSLTDTILSNGNRAFSELYQIRGELYLESKNFDAAQREFELAVFYNENFEPAKKALEQLEELK